MDSGCCGGGDDDVRQTLDLGGPDVISWRDLVSFVAYELREPVNTMDIPVELATLLSGIVDRVQSNLPFPLDYKPLFITDDLIEMTRDLTASNDGFSELGIVPSKLEGLAVDHVRAHRFGGYEWRNWMLPWASFATLLSLGMCLMFFFFFFFFWVGKKTGTDTTWGASKPRASGRIWTRKSTTGTRQCRSADSEKKLRHRRVVLFVRLVYQKYERLDIHKHKSTLPPPLLMQSRL